MTARSLINRVIKETMGAKSYAMVYTNNDFGLNMLKYMTEEAERLGIEITDTEAVASGEKDYTAIVSKMRQTNPEVVLIVANYNEVANCVKQIRQVGWDVPVGTFRFGADRPAGGAVRRRSKWHLLEYCICSVR